MIRLARLAAVALLSLSLSIPVAGCGHLGDVLKLATASIDNPITGVDIYRVKNTYAATLELAVEYRRYCWARPYRALLADPVGKPLCAKRRAVVRTFDVADDKAAAAIAAAESFVANNPTLSAAAIVNAAWDAVTAFKNSVPAK